MSTHTKFESLVIERSARTWILQVEDRPSDIVAVVIKNGHYAKLFQAAPELLGALKDLLEWVRNPGEDDSPRNEAVIQAAEKAIFKVEGRDS